MNINHLHPCAEAAEWLETQPDVATAWNCCQRGDWMMWLLTNLPTPKDVSVTLAIRFARSVLHLVPAGEERPRLAIEAAERWLAEPTEDNRAAARAAARAACWAAGWADWVDETIADAADAATLAARAAADATITGAADAARSAAYTYDDTNADTSDDAALADVIREVVSAEWVTGALKS